MGSNGMSHSTGKVGMSQSSSSASIGQSEAPEVTTHVPSRSGSPSVEERSNGWLPTIKHGHHRRKDGGGAADVSGSDVDDLEDGTLLPPIGGHKSKRESKSN